MQILYGATELTIASTLHRYDTVAATEDAEQGVVPIGVAYPDKEVIIVDEFPLNANGRVGRKALMDDNITSD